MSMITVGAIGSDVLLRTLTTTCTKAVDLATYMATSSYEGFDKFNQVLVETDLKDKIDLVQSIVDEIENTGELKTSVKKSVNSVHEAITKILEHLESVKKLKENHSQKYFASWRSVDCSPQISAIQRSIKILEARLDLMIKVISMNNKLS
jgi:predicted transcriptional regulator